MRPHDYILFIAHANLTHPLALRSRPSRTISLSLPNWQVTVTTGVEVMKTYDEIGQIIMDLAPSLRDGGARAEAERELPADLVGHLREAGFFKIWIPKSLGGWEVDPVTACRVFEAIARIDSAAAWCVQMSNAVTVLGRFFSDRAVAEIFDGGNTIMADAFHPVGAAVEVDAGYRLNGQFSFSSGCRHADWFIGLAAVMEGDAPRMVDGQPLLKLLALPMSDASVVDNWNSLGMRGTGSHDVKCNDLFVPEHRTATLAPIERANNSAWPRAHDNLSIWHLIASIATTSLGVAQQALDEFVEVAKNKTAAYRTETVDRHALTHYRVGEAHVTLKAARANFYDAMGQAWASAGTGTPISVQEKCDLQIAASYAARAACDAIEIVAASAGANAFRNESALERHLRDLRTVTQHAFISTDRYEDVGALMLGQTPKWGFLHF